MNTESPSDHARPRPDAAHPARGTNSVVIVAQEDSLIGPDLRWPLRIAKLRDADIALLILAPTKVSKGRTRVDLSAFAEQAAYERGISERMRAALDAYLGPDQWMGERPAARADSSPPSRTRGRRGQSVDPAPAIGPDSLRQPR